MVVLKVEITVKVQNLIGSLCILYLLYHWSLGNQRKYADLLFIISKPSTRKWAYPNSSTLTCTITRHTKGGGGYFAEQGNKPCFSSGLIICELHHYSFWRFCSEFTSLSCCCYALVCRLLSVMATLLGLLCRILFTTFWLSKTAGVIGNLEPSVE